MKTSYKSGFIAVIGRPNVGKSTLINTLLKEKIVIISDKPQTTRSRIQCVLTRPDYQIIFIDTPGIHKPKNRLGEYMVRTAQSTLEEVDAIVFVMDAADGFRAGDGYIVNLIQEIDTPVILALNKTDRLSPSEIAVMLKEFEDMKLFDDIIPISALMGTNIDELEKLLVSYLTEGPQYYPEDMITDQPERMIIAEIIREKALELLRDEIPHGIGVNITGIEERKGGALMSIQATIYCEKKTHKGIILGKGGRMLKDIGTRARMDIERLLGTKVYLDLWVKIKEDWRNNAGALRELGYQ